MAWDSIAPVTLSPDEQNAVSNVTQDAPISVPSASSPVVPDTTTQTYAKTLTYGLPGAGVGLLDTLGQSIGVFHDDTVPDFLRSFSSGTDSFGDYYTRNRQPLRMAGEIAGVMLPGMVAMKALKAVRFAREAGYLGTVMKDSSVISTLMGSSADLTALEGRLSSTAAQAATQQGLFAGKTFAIPAVNAIRRTYYAARIAESARTTAAMEVGYRSLYNASETFFPADYTLTDQIKWGAAGFLGTAALELAAGRYAVRNLIKGAANAAAVGNTSADISDVLFRPGDRGAGVTRFAYENNDIKARAEASGDPTIMTNAAQDQTAITGILRKNIQAMATDPHPILPSGDLSPAQVDLALNTLRKNETTFLFAKKLGQVPDNSTDFFNTLADLRVKADHDLASDIIKANGPVGSVADPAKLNAAYSNYNNTLNAADQIHYVIENDGRFSAYRNRADNFLDTNGFGSILRTTSVDQDLVNGTIQPVRHSALSVGSGDSSVMLRDNLTYTLPANPSPMDYSKLYAMGSKFIQDYKPVPGQKFILNQNVDWRTIEMTLALGAKQPAALPAIQLDGAFGSLQDAAFHVLDQKYQEFSRLMAVTERKPTTALQASVLNLSKITPAQVLQRLNLPEHSNMLPSPLLDVFAQARLQGDRTLMDTVGPAPGTLFNPTADHPLDILQGAMRDAAGATNNQQTYDLLGPLLFQNDTRPLFVAATSTPMLGRNDALIHGMIESRRDLQLSRLAEITPDQAPLVSAVVAHAAGNPVTDAARAVQTLNDGVVSGKGVIVPQDRINEQFPTLKAAQLLQQDSDRLIDNHVANLAQTQLKPVVGTLLDPKNKAALIDFNRIENSYRYGFDIKTMEPQPNGTVRFVLNPESELNAALMKQHFPDVEADPDGSSYLPDMSVTARKQGFVPLTVSSPAAAGAQAISNMSRQSGIENNVLKAALSIPPTKIRDFHLPTPELFQDNTWFVRNSSGNVVNTYTGGAGSQNEIRAKAAAQSMMDMTGEAHVALPVADVRRRAAIDGDFFNLIDYSDQLRKDSAIKGGLARTEIDTSDTTLKSMVSSLNQQFLNVGVRARAAVFEPQLNYAFQAAQIAGKTAAGEANIFDRYQAIMFSRSPQAPTGILAKVYSSVESGLDTALNVMYAHYAEMSASTADGVKNAKGFSAQIVKNLSPDEFRAYQNATIVKADATTGGVGQSYAPFQNTLDWAESTFRERTPPTARSLIAKMSLLSSTMSLRFLDVGTAVNNLAGLVTNMPSVMSALRQLPGENRDEWLARTAAWSTNIAGNTQTFSSLKAMNNVTRAFYNGELTEPMANAARLGYFQPEYASLARVLSAPITKANPLNKVVDAAVWMADKSEVLSRKIAWGMGYKIGKDLHGFQDERSSYIFANNFVNDMIGNYSPTNKPGMFQGAVGLPLGAFQTYMFNFYRRLYGYVERGDVRSAMAQYAAQASVFGAQSTPGWSAFNYFLGANEDHSDNISSRLDRKLPSGVSELLLNGSLSNIPAIFGHGGLAFYTRGSVDFTQPPATLLDMSKAPPIQFMANVAGGVKKTIDNIFSNEGFSLQQQEEILATFSTNRALKSVMEMAANVKVDQQGEAVQTGTRDAIHIAAALLGTVPSATRRLQSSYAAQSATRLTQEDLRAKLNDKTRAMLYGGEFDTSSLQAAASDYLRSGGNPGYFGEWLRNIATTATTPKAIATMQELSRSGKWLEFLNMLTALQQNPPK